ncbi:MAG: hypothetical protein LBR80_16190 [Deltaproteobacteria bacterium]|jgi:hypothetical protein|nr:hypothetical protein [Deltaproteobacteria bacterium]
MQSNAPRGNAREDRISVALFLSESEIDRLKSLTFGELNAETTRRGTSVTWHADCMNRDCPMTGASRAPKCLY